MQSDVHKRLNDAYSIVFPSFESNTLNITVLFRGFGFFVYLETLIVSLIKSHFFF